MSDNPERPKAAEGTAPAPPPQLVLDLPHRAALGAADFLVGPANRAAVAMIDQWPDWPAQSLLLVGPAGSGKSHLVNVWRERSGGVTVPAHALAEAAVEPLSRERAIAIEDIDRLADNEGSRQAAERVAFHLLNLAREQRTSVLVTSRVAPGDIDSALPDLRSRVRALPFVEVAAPDDALISGLLVKLFDDRQLKIEPAVVTYLVRHMERTMAAAHRIVADLDARALATKRRVTRTLAAEVLGEK